MELGMCFCCKPIMHVETLKIHLIRSLQQQDLLVLAKWKKGLEVILRTVISDVVFSTIKDAFSVSRAIQLYRVLRCNTECNIKSCVGHTRTI